MLSRFVYTYNVTEDIIALYHSLTIDTIFLHKEELPIILKDSHSTEYQLLLARHFIIENKDTDIDLLHKAQSFAKKLSLANTYVLTSENCNFACTYCFLSKITHTNGNLRNMSKEVADATISLLQREYQHSPNVYSKFISFFGGEPLMNIDIIQYIVERLKNLIDNNEFPADIKFGIVTNGALLTNDILIYCKENNIGVGISYDIIEKAGQNRITKNGKETFSLVREKIEMCKSLQVEYSISTTVTEEILLNKEQVIDEIIHLAPHSISLNMLIADNLSNFDKKYYERYADFLIEAFCRLREAGIYEDRMMRKINSFTNHQLYFYDCCAAGGNQFVIRPDGSVGICHAFINNNKYFNASVFEDDLLINNNPDSYAWSQRTPLSNERCIDCECLGICGGGCGYSSYQLHGSIYEIDDSFCIVSKKLLNWMIRDLYSKISE